MSWLSTRTVTTAWATRSSAWSPPGRWSGPPRPAAADRPARSKSTGCCGAVRTHHCRPRRPAHRATGCSCSPTKPCESRRSTGSARDTLAGFAERLHPGPQAIGTAAGRRHPGLPAAGLLPHARRLRGPRLDWWPWPLTPPATTGCCEATGGDAAALAEIAAAYTLIGTRPSPDLLAALRLAWHRDRLADRNTGIPARLPAAWASPWTTHPCRSPRPVHYRPGRPGAGAGRAGAGGGAATGGRRRPSSVARSITDPDRQAQAPGRPGGRGGRPGNSTGPRRSPGPSPTRLAGAGAGPLGRARTAAARWTSTAPRRRPGDH